MFTFSEGICSIVGIFCPMYIKIASDIFPSDANIKTWIHFLRSNNWFVSYLRFISVLLIGGFPPGQTELWVKILKLPVNRLFIKGQNKRCSSHLSAPKTGASFDTSCNYGASQRRCRGCKGQQDKRAAEENNQLKTEFLWFSLCWLQHTT